MKAEKISLIINSICKEQGIDFCSTNPHYVSLCEDSQKMAKIYLQLKEITGILQEIEDRHNFSFSIKDKLNNMISELNEVDHIIIKLAKEILKEND